MKTAYELAMERLSKSAPGPKLTDAQKQALAELDARYQAKIAEREIFLQGQLAAAREQGDAEAFEQLQKQLAGERRKFREELEEKKEAIRRGA